MKICFELSMPNRGSWNGGWSGAGNLYAVVKSFGRSKWAKETTTAILSKKSYYHRWDDGWGASVAVRVVDDKEARSIKKLSKGFSGYDWMISNIIDHQTCYDAKPETKVVESVKVAQVAEFMDNGISETYEKLGEQITQLETK